MQAGKGCVQITLVKAGTDSSLERDATRTMRMLLRSPLVSGTLAGKVNDGPYLDEGVHKS